MLYLLYYLVVRSAKAVIFKKAKWAQIKGATQASQVLDGLHC